MLENLPQAERETYLRDLKKERHRYSGFDWESTGKSLLYNFERGNLYNIKTRSPLAVFRNHFGKDTRIYRETQREERIIYTFRGEKGTSD